MAKMAKDTQTDYTRGGKTISDTAISLYPTNLQRMDSYLDNPYRRLNYYLDNYYDNNVNQSDFLRGYNRRMANATANNYAATSGGYSTSGQRAYNDQQMYMNDLAARLRAQGVTDAHNMANQDFQNMRGANADYNAAYHLGKDYSDIERYNNMVDQNNSFMNQLGGIAGGVGKVFSAIPTPATQAIGAGLQVGGNLASTDVSSLASRLGVSGVQGYGAGAQGDMYTNIGEGLATTANRYPNGLLGQLYGGSRTRQVNSPNSTLFTPEQLKAYGIDPNSI